MTWYEDQNGALGFRESLGLGFRVLCVCSAVLETQLLMLVKGRPASAGRGNERLGSGVNKDLTTSNCLVDHMNPQRGYSYTLIGIVVV